MKPTSIARWFASSTCTLAIAFLASTLFGHDGPHEHVGQFEEVNRHWQLAGGSTQFDGSFVSAENGKVAIHLRNGRVVTLFADRLSESDQIWLETKLKFIAKVNQPVALSKVTSSVEASPSRQDKKPEIANHFQPFVDQKAITIRWDSDHLFVESNGMPNHEMMVGITAWQQQIPIPQNYSGDNAWQIPLKPVPAEEPMSAKTNFFRGAIALAVNGVPIFNPIKNDGKTDTKLAGELDEFGGHCGRADDYHYHLPPVHLEKVVGEGKPIAYALDGYPILGLQSKAKAVESKLDALNGHKDDQGNYHYHSTANYPYLNGGFFGKVVVRGGQVDPQPRGNPIRPAARPLRGAKITGFKKSEDGKFVSLEYSLRNETRIVSYTTEDFKSYSFTYDNGAQGKSTETYSARPDRGGKAKRPKSDRAKPLGSQKKGGPRDGKR